MALGQMGLRPKQNSPRRLRALFPCPWICLAGALSHKEGLLGLPSLLSRPPFLLVMAGMAGRAKHFQIVRHVVCVHPVPMMDHQPACLPAPIAAVLLDHLSVCRAFRAVLEPAVLRPGPPPRLRRKSKALQPPLKTGQRNPVVPRHRVLRLVPVHIQGHDLRPARFPNLYRFLLASDVAFLLIFHGLD